MQRLAERHSFNITDRALRHLSIRLRSRPETADNAAEISAERTKLNEHKDAHEQAKEERVAASAEIEYVDGLVDACVMGIVREVLVITSGRRDEPRYIKLFPKKPSGLMLGLNDPKQDRFVKTLISALREDGAYSNLATNADRLGSLQAKLEAAISKRDELYQPEARAAAELRLAMDRCKRAYNLTWAKLQLTFPRDPSLVESFFTKLSRRSPDHEETRTVEVEPEVVAHDLGAGVAGDGE